MRRYRQCDAAYSDQDSTAAAKDAIGQVLATFMAALAEEDIDRWTQVTLPDFIAYDAGVIWKGNDLFLGVKAAHAGGNRCIWHITDLEVRVRREWSLATYVNRGSIQNQSDTAPATWLESALLERSKGCWRLAFLHSSRAVREGG